MTLALRRLLGLRPDLNLGARWWHRLFAVAYWAASVAIVGRVVVVAYHAPELRDQNIHVITTLSAFTSQHPELPNTVPAFVRVGRIAFRKNAGSLETLYLNASRVLCSANLAAHPEEVAAFFRANEPSTGATDAKQAAIWLDVQTKAGREGHCIGNENTLPAESTNIVAYSFKAGALARSGGLAVLWAVLSYIAWSIVAISLYFRGLIYVVCGPRRRDVGSSVDSAVTNRKDR